MTHGYQNDVTINYTYMAGHVIWVSEHTDRRGHHSSRLVFNVIKPKKKQLNLTEHTLFMVNAKRDQ